MTGESLVNNQKAILGFYFVRNKLFYVNTGYAADHFGAKEILENVFKNNMATCMGKHSFLGNCLTSLGFGVRYLLFPFRWSDLPVAYPNRIKILAEHLPITKHVAIRIVCGSTDYFVDATWDQALSGMGFPINSFLDEKEMRNAIVPCGEPQIFTDLEKLIRARSERFSLRSDSENSVLYEFYPVLNEWLNAVRGKRRGAS